MQCRDMKDKVERKWLDENKGMRDGIESSERNYKV